jgi:hypothetical protein
MDGRRRGDLLSHTSTFLELRRQQCAACWRSHSLTHSLTHSLKIVESICTYTYYWATMQVDLDFGASYLDSESWLITHVRPACLSLMSVSE